jgi:hypothetical protein
MNTKKQIKLKIIRKVSRSMYVRKAMSSL